jgi:hypothetical protein
LYRAALLGYLLGGGESNLARAYDLGRAAIDGGFGLLDILKAHHRALNAILESTRDVRRALDRMKASQGFLLEALSSFDMACRGYVALLPGTTVRDGRGIPPPSTRRQRGRPLRPFLPPIRDIT